MTQRFLKSLSSVNLAFGKKKFFCRYICDAYKCFAVLIGLPEELLLALYEYFFVVKRSLLAGFSK